MKHLIESNFQIGQLFAFILDSSYRYHAYVCIQGQTAPRCSLILSTNFFMIANDWYSRRVLKKRTWQTSLYSLRVLVLPRCVYSRYKHILSVLSMEEYPQCQLLCKRHLIPPCEQATSTISHVLWAASVWDTSAAEVSLLILNICSHGGGCSEEWNNTSLGTKVHFGAGVFTEFSPLWTLFLAAGTQDVRLLVV